jgi:hypothetical protein
MSSGSENGKAERVQAGWFEQLTAVMERLAAGDPAAIEELYVGFGDPIRAALRDEFRSLNVTRVDPAEIDGLVLDVVTDLAGRAGSWDPSWGVTPWRWARRQLRSIVIRYLGQFTDPLPEGGVPEVEAAPPAQLDEDALATLDRLAGRDPRVALLLEALDRVARPRHQEIMFQFRLQAGQGDQSPSLTVAREQGLKPDSVRQTTKRVLDRVRALTQADPHFASLADLPLLQRAA